MSINDSHNKFMILFVSLAIKHKNGTSTNNVHYVIAAFHKLNASRLITHSLVFP